MEEKISVFGLGKLGCTMLACFAHKGWEVVGMDINEEFVNIINDGKSPIYEPGVDELIKNNKSKISATTNVTEAIEKTDISFVIVPTPSTDMGYFSIKAVEAVVTEIGKALQTINRYHTVVITSTVLPGDMDVIVKLLEKTSGKKVIDDFGVCYNPDFIALGSVVRNFLNPDMILIGESDEKAGEKLHNIHKKLVDNSPNIHRMNFHNAELTKIALNSYCTLKITFANVLAEICENMPGGDVDAVTNALGDDTRIGHKYLKGGLSYGGPCFPRDNRAFAYSAKKFGVTNILATKTDEINDYNRNDRIPKKLLKVLKDKGAKEISVLGLTYKNDTTLVEESAAINIVKKLAKENVIVKVFDPAGMPAAKKELKEFSNIIFCNTALECIENTSVCFVATPWQEFKELTETDFVSKMKEPTIFDAWNLYSFVDNEEKIHYLRIGKEPKKINTIMYE
jgi:UDPglucose 6-dehydrogenase